MESEKPQTLALCLGRAWQDGQQWEPGAGIFKSGFCREESRAGLQGRGNAITKLPIYVSNSPVRQLELIYLKVFTVCWGLPSLLRTAVAPASGITSAGLFLPSLWPQTFLHEFLMVQGEFPFP